ncbi:HD-domain/PDEase-like protein [Xylariaceae sp. FL0594]|nr:HD-domain/PDEase-like protein [Xylariaceae sp. FL0594]
MDINTCNVVYVDRNVYQDRLLESRTSDILEAGDLRANLELLLSSFGHVRLCTKGSACIDELLQLNDTSDVDLRPTLVLIDIPHDDLLEDGRYPAHDTSPGSTGSANSVSEHGAALDLYGIRLLEKIVYETHLRSLSKLVVPIPVVSFPLLRTPPGTDGTTEHYAADQSTVDRVLRRCLDSGAVDVLVSPLHVKTLTSLQVHAYRAHREVARDQQELSEFRKGRKRSWVGVHKEKPFAYLREAMVSGLMGGICRSDEESDSRISTVKIEVPSKHRAAIAESPGTWHFCAPRFDDDSLLIAATQMFKHALAMPELEKWRLPADKLTTFLVACRAAYNQFVPYHNFRHAVDVLQATFDFLVHIGTLPPYPFSEHSLVSVTQTSPATSLLGPFEALTLLVSAIGHDVGHPGVNNGFLVALNAPLAQLYNDRSVLESFHCAAYSQILRRHWPSVFEDAKMRTLMISSILATDMGLHFDYMKKLGDLQEQLRTGPPTEAWSQRMLDDQKALVCSILIKCADISNVARRYDAALQWMNILCDEFSRQAAMEDEIGIPSSLISPPKKDFMSLAKAQLGFVNLFAVPLFQGVADILPQMQYTVQELEKNKCYFEKAVEEIPSMPEEMQILLTQKPLDADIMLLVESLAGDDRCSSSGTARADLVQIPTNHAEMKESGSSPPGKPTQVPSMPSHHKEVSGATSYFNKVPDFDSNGASHAKGSDVNLAKREGKQHTSDITEENNPAPCPADWQSQATSATTGKMPLSPSTQGSSIVSQDSMGRPSSDPTTAATPPPNSSSTTTPIAATDSTQNSEEESNGTLKPHGTLKKKTSRFRMNVSTFFRRNKSAGSPVSGGTGGTGG